MTISLTSHGLGVRIRPERGADIVSIVDTRTGIDVMFRTPWSQRAAELVASGRQPWPGDSVQSWLAGYEGGWQLLCPNAADPRRRHDVELGFHGEASVVPWQVDNVGHASAQLSVELLTCPLRIERSVRAEGTSVTVTDTVTNLAPLPIGFDYQHHPAFGEPLVEIGTELETDAGTYTADPGHQAGPFEPGSVHSWPATAENGTAVAQIDGAPRAMVGWLDELAHGWLAVRNRRRDLAAHVEWDTAVMSRAWLWQEYDATIGYPWFGRARAVGVEPSSAPTNGPDRDDVVTLSAHTSLTTWVRITTGDASSPRPEHDGGEA